MSLKEDHENEVEIEVEIGYVMEVRMASSSNFLVTSMEMHEKAILQRQELGNRIKFAIPSLFASSAHCSARSSLQMNLSVEMASPIVSLSSPTHPQLQVALHSGTPSNSSWLCGINIFTSTQK